MKKILESVSPFKAARLGSLLCGVFAFPVAAFFFMLRPMFGPPPSVWSDLLDFLIWLGFSWVVGSIAGYLAILGLCWLYNLLAKLLGGIEFTVR